MIEQFREAIISAGLEPPDRIEMGKFIRFPGAGKNGRNRAGWCQLFPDGCGGIFGDWATGLNQTWQAKRDKPYTAQDRTEFDRMVKEARRQAEEQRKKEQAAAAAKARKRIEKAPEASPSHPYLARKGIGAHQGVRQEGELLLIPMIGPAGDLLAVQEIDQNGGKMFWPAGCTTKGAMFKIGSDPAPGEPVLVCEGFATGAAIHEATGHQVIVAFTANNLERVARAARDQYPDRPITLCGDDDAETEGNPGITAATAAAQAVGGKLAVPGMGKKADFWDLRAERGEESVRAAMAAAVEITAGTEHQDGAAGPADPNAVIQALAAASTVEYEQRRTKAAKALGVRTTVLDRLVKDARKTKEDSDLPFEETEPWPVKVKADQLLSEISTTIRRFIVCSREVADAVALWVTMTWFMDVVQVAPLAVITAPEKRCGKTQLLSVLARLVARAIAASSISPAALYRAIDAWNPTLLIDEADAFMRDNEELRGIINSGHTRDSAYVIRTVGDDHIPTKFRTWGAKAIAGIGHVADTLMDRAIVLELRRKLPNEDVERLRYAEPDLFITLRSKLARFAADYSEQVREARPPLPASLNDRAQDNWEPLLAIAMVAGGSWPEIGTTAALKLSGTESATQAIGTELLADIQEVFELRGTDRISTANLIKALCEDDEKPWSSLLRGNPITPRKLATMLKGYGICSGTIRIGPSTPKGFLLGQFTEAFTRYLTPPEQSATTPQPSTDGHLRVADKKVLPQQAPLSATSSVADNPQRCGYVANSQESISSFFGDCCGVADNSTPPNDEIIEEEI